MDLPLLPRESAPQRIGHACTASRSRGLDWAAAAGFGLIFVAALLLWWRYGPSVFIDGLAAAWSCF
jgi:hypothetical protein